MKQVDERVGAYPPKPAVRARKNSFLLIRGRVEAKGGSCNVDLGWCFGILMIKRRAGKMPWNDDSRLLTT